VRRSSSSCEGLFAGVLSRGGAAVQVDDEAWLRALLDVEAALARAGARAGLLPADAAAAITAACARTAGFDVVQLGQDAASAGNPVVPLVRAIEAAAGEAGAYVHLGATSQDILDTAMVLVARRAIGPLTDDLEAAMAAAEALARAHRGTVMAARTLLQQAVPTTFGLKAAGWAVLLAGARRRLVEVDRGLPVQLAGAAGTLAGFGGAGSQVVQALADELDLAVPLLPWHTARLPVADLAGALGTAAGALSKVAADVVLMAQTEVAEVAEGAAGRGGSSAMPHKRNPVAAVSVRAAARRAPGLVATLLASMEQEHERAAGAWHAEWETLSDLLRCTGSAAAWLADGLSGLSVDPARMRANLEATASELCSSAVAGALAPALGRAAAHELVASSVGEARRRGEPLVEVLLGQPAVTGVLTRSRLEELLDPLQHVGEADRLVDAALRSLRDQPARRTA
jgi:3-carboxy-cis,cis-muconate cycloisomerase